MAGVITRRFHLARTGYAAGMEQEDHGERVNRELIELLNELRVALPGAQVLLAFLLTIPFMQRFDQLDAADRRIYMFAVLAAALGSMLLIAPSAHHRVRFRQRAKEDIIRAANFCAIAGMGLLALAVGAGVYLVADVVYGTPFSGIVGGALVAMTVLLWFVMPLVFFRYDHETDQDANAPAAPPSPGGADHERERQLEVEGQRSRH
jgi:Kef-type K+ transport system membrane component KefB